MTRVIDRYIARTILASTGVVAIVVIALLFLLLFISEVDDMGKGSFGLAQLMAWSVLKLPGRIYYVLPVVTLLGALFALGGLAAGRELIVIRSAGVSMKRLAVSVGIAGFVLAVIAAVLGELASPISTQKADLMLDQALHGHARQSTSNGLWLRQSGYLLRISSVLPGGNIEGINIYRLSDDGQLQLALSADKAHDDGHKLVIHKPRLTHFIDRHHSHAESPEQKTLPIGIKPRVLELAVIQPEQLSSYGLWQYINYLDRHGIDAGDYQLALWRNIVTPFTVWVLVLFALPFAFGSLRSASAGQRLFMGGLVGLLFFLFNEIVSSTGPVYGIPPWLAASLPTVLLAGGTGYWMHRLN